ncbi:hypothetical protein [uncultured Clostridium sp.]|uniref:hypothetical protein n=1 Tax=uncultured Clostridium sp. TaxID=59620 RepID=UPI00260AADD3|nr:hypothetical protein [uncultured Clostridium sp.]
MTKKRYSTINTVIFTQDKIDIYEVYRKFTLPNRTIRFLHYYDPGERINIAKEMGAKFGFVVKWMN